MARLRALQDAILTGPFEYAVVSSWFAALYVRTERCVEARARLTRRLQDMSASRKAAVGSSCAKLVRDELPSAWHPEEDAVSLPALLRLLRQKRCEVDDALGRVGLHEVSVRSGKGLSAALSITGTVIAFTPALPVGVGLMAAGAGVGATTAGADFVGVRMQKEQLQEELTRLSEAEDRVQQALDALIVRHFAGVPPSEWDIARGAGVSFDHVSAEAHNAAVPTTIGASVTGSGAAAARAVIGASSASRSAAVSAGLVIGRSLSVAGSVVSAGDFIYSLLTNNPNRRSLEQMGSFLEAKAEAYEVWAVLLCHWLGFLQDDPAVLYECNKPRVGASLRSGGYRWEADEESGGHVRVFRARLDLRVGRMHANMLGRDTVDAGADWGARLRQATMRALETASAPPTVRGEWSPNLASPRASACVGA